MQREQTSHIRRHQRLLSLTGDLGSKVSPYRQLLVIFSILYHETLFVGQMQQTDEAETRADVLQLCLGIDVLEVVHDICELEFAIVCHGDCGSFWL